jgi:hypothetical protein
LRKVKLKRIGIRDAASFRVIECLSSSGRSFEIPVSNNFHIARLDQGRLRPVQFMEISGLPAFGPFIFRDGNSCLKGIMNVRERLFG